MDRRGGQQGITQSGGVSCDERSKEHMPSVVRSVRLASATRQPATSPRPKPMARGSTDRSIDRRRGFTGIRAHQLGPRAPIDLGTFRVLVFMHASARLAESRLLKYRSPLYPMGRPLAVFMLCFFCIQRHFCHRKSIDRPRPFDRSAYFPFSRFSRSIHPYFF